MGDAYKGLTIRIGADMTELNRALRSSNSAISEMQKQLRTLQKAAKLDPAGFKAASEQMDVMGDRAQALTAKLRTMKSSDFMKHLKDDTQDAALKAKLATAEYSKMCDEIKRFKNALASAAGHDLKKKDPFKDIEEGSKAAKEKIVQLAREIDKTSDGTKELGEYAKLLGRYFRASADNDAAKLTAETRKFKTELTAAEAETRALYAQMARMATANPSVTLTKGFEKFKREMQSADSIATELRTELSKLDNALKLDPSNMEVARLKMANMQEQVRLNVVQLNELQKQINALKGQGIDKVSASAVDLKQDIAKAENEVTELTQSLDRAKAQLIQLGSDTSVNKQGRAFQLLEERVKKYSAELKAAKKRQDQLASAQVYRNLTSQYATISASTTKLANDMQHATSKAVALRGAMQQLGWAMYSTLTPMAMMFGYSAVHSAEVVDEAYRNMRKTVQGTDEQFEELKQAAIDFSRTHVTSSDQILEIQAMGGQLGIAVENLGAFAETVSNIEIATNLDADKAAEQLGQLQAILNDMTEDDFDNFGDALVRLGNNNATLEDKIMNVMLRIASMGTITGFTTTELLAWSTSIAATGQGAEAAGTAISKTFSDIEAAVGKGGKTLKAFADVAQMSSKKFADGWNTDPSSVMRAFIQGLKAIETNGGSADATLEKLGITSVRQKQSILGLMQTIDGLNDNLIMSSHAWNGIDDEEWGAAGDAAREAQRKAEGFSGTIKILRNNIKAFGVEMGESFSWAIGMLGDFVANATQAYSDMPNLGKQMINFGTLAAAGLGPAVVATNALVGAGGALIKSVKSGKDAWGKTVKGAAKYNHTLWQQAAAATGVVDANGKAVKSWDQMTRAQKAAALGTSALKTALVGLAAAAVVSTILLIAEQYQKAEERATNLRKATEGLNQSMKVTSQSFIDAANSINSANYGKVIQAIGNVGVALDEAIAKQAEMADSFTSVWSEINGSEYALESYLEVIKDLTDGSRLSAEEQGKLAAAVAGYNEIMGTSVKVTDAQNGKLSVSTEELAKNADAWIDNAKAQAAQTQMVELQQQQLTNVVNLKNAELELSAAQYQLTEAIARGETDLHQYQGAVDAAQDKVDRATDAMEANEKQVEDLTKAYHSSTDGLKRLSSGLGITEDEFVKFASVLGVEGEEAVEEFAAAILAGDSEVADAAAAIQIAAKGMAEGNSLEWGYECIKNFSKGMDLAKFLVTGVATNIANATKNILGHSIAKEGPFHNGGKGEAEWGAHLVRNFAGGMVNEIDTAVQAANALARSVTNSLAADGLTVQARVAGDFASDYGRAAAQTVTNNTTSAVNNYYSVGNVDYTGDAQVERAVMNLFDALERRANT